MRPFFIGYVFGSLGVSYIAVSMHLSGARSNVWLGQLMFCAALPLAGLMFAPWSNSDGGPQSDRGLVPSRIWRVAVSLLEADCGLSSYLFLFIPSSLELRRVNLSASGLFELIF